MIENYAVAILMVGIPLIAMAIGSVFLIGGPRK